jgi:uncharacterized protein YndB with AHSA1/START domain
VPGRSTEHATFVLERTYAAAPARVFEAWASAEAKSAWFGPRGDGGPAIELEFEVGGRERFAAGGPGGATYTYLALYQDIVPGERIVYTYEIYRDEARMSVSVATIEFAPAGDGTQLTMTEQGVFLDGHDTVAQREHGTRDMLEQLGSAIGSA